MIGTIDGGVIQLGHPLVDAYLELVARFVLAVGLRLGHAASLYQPVAYKCFRQAAARLETSSADVRLQWHALVLLAAAVDAPSTRSTTKRSQPGAPPCSLHTAKVIAAMRGAAAPPSCIDYRPRFLMGKSLRRSPGPGNQEFEKPAGVASRWPNSEAAHRYLDQVTSACGHQPSRASSGTFGASATFSPKSTPRSIASTS